MNPKEIHQKIYLINIFRLLISTLLFFGCSQKIDYYSLGVESFKDKKYALAKSQFKTVPKNSSTYYKSIAYIKKIDSIETIIYDSLTLVKKEKSKVDKNINPYRKKFTGTYKVEINGVSSKNEVEVYRLHQDGTAEWLWVYYNGNRKKIDEIKRGIWQASEDAITISIEGNSGIVKEVFSLNGGSIFSSGKRWLAPTNENYTAFWQ